MAAPRCGPAGLGLDDNTPCSASHHGVQRGGDVVVLGDLDELDMADEVAVRTPTGGRRSRRCGCTAAAASRTRSTTCSACRRRRRVT